MKDCEDTLNGWDMMKHDMRHTPCHSSVPVVLAALLIGYVLGLLTPFILMGILSLLKVV